MYTHPEMARLVAGQRIHEMHARADADRRALQARKARRSARTRVARWPWLGRRRMAGRPAIGYPVPRNA